MIDLDQVRIGTIGWTRDIDGMEIPVRVIARAMVGTFDVITYATCDRTGGDYVGAMFTGDLMPEPWPSTEARWKADDWTTIGTYPPYEQEEPAP